MSRQVGFRDHLIGLTIAAAYVALLLASSAAHCGRCGNLCVGAGSLGLFRLSPLATSNASGVAMKPLDLTTLSHYGE